MKRLVVLLGVSAMLLTSSGCGMLRGRQCLLRRPRPTPAPYARYVPGVPAAVAPAPVGSCGTCGVPVEPACGTPYETYIPSGQVIETTPFEEVPVETEIIEGVPLGAQRPAIAYPATRYTRMPSPPSPGLVSGPESGTVRN